MYEIIISEVRPDIRDMGTGGAEPVVILQSPRSERYRQIVDSLDLPRLIAEVNRKPRARRIAPDKGKS